jgi:hypothetical protein
MSRWHWIFGSLTEPPKNTDKSARYVQLVVALVLLTMAIHLRLKVSPAYRGDPNGNCLVALMLLLNILAWQFRWPAPWLAGLRLLALGVVAFVFSYVFYWSHALYP